MVTAKYMSMIAYNALGIGIGARTEYSQIPPIRDLLVHGHEASVYIRLFGKCATSLVPDLFAVVEEGVGEGGSDRCKRETVRHRKADGKKERAVRLVRLKIEGSIVVDDAGDIVHAPRVIE